MPYSGISREQYKRDWGDQFDAARLLYQQDFERDPGRGMERMFGDNRYFLEARYRQRIGPAAALADIP